MPPEPNGSVEPKTLAEQNGHARPPADPTPDAAALLGVVRENATGLLREVPVPPSLLRLSAGGVTVELRWAPAKRPDGPASRVAAVQAVQAAQMAPVAQDVPPEPAPAHLTAPAVGVFYRRPDPAASAFVVEDDVVTKGQQVGIVEAMKLMIPVEADRAGQIAEVLVEDGSPVEFGQPLFALRET